MLPGTVLYVVGADALTRGLSQGRLPWGLIGAVAVAGVVLALLVRYARRTLQAKETDTVAEAASAEVEPSHHA
jgi:membrane protein implicated in regulation of membrane protease activity